MPLPYSSSKRVKTIPIADHHEQMRMLRNQVDVSLQELRVELARRDEVIRAAHAVIDNRDREIVDLRNALNKATKVVAVWRHGAAVLARLLADNLATGKE